ncbi:MAG: ATP-binding protein [Actinomycetota bacterium]|nr:ATP-binding protein [Actinomycetota bacterium]
MNFDQLFALTSDARFISVDHIIVEVNDAARELYGAATKDALVGRSIDDLVPKEYRSSLRERTDETLEGRGRTREASEEILLADGSRVPVLIRSCPIDYGPASMAPDRFGDKRAVLSLLRPFTVTADAERKLRQRAERSAMFTDVSLQLARANDAELDATIENVLGVIARSEGADRAYVNLFDDADRTIFSCAFEWTAPGIEPQREFVQGFSRTALGWSAGVMADHDVVHIPDLLSLPPEAAAERDSFGRYGVKSVLQVPMVAGGELIGVLGFNSVNISVRWPEDTIEFVRGVCAAIVTAVTRRNAVHSMERAKAEAEQANQAKDLFLSRMSHELRAPLNAVLGFTELLMLDEGRQPSDRVSLRQVHESGLHLLALVEDVLDISRIEAGHLAMSIEPVDLASVIDSAVNMVRNAGLDDGLDVIVDHGGRPTVAADRQRLQQVLVNLVSNACKYNKSGGQVEVVVSTAEHALSGSPGRAAITVIDTGVGIPAEHLGRVFDPFDRLGREESPIEGTGIGLTLTRMIVEMMGGAIALDSVDGEGTSVTVEFDRAIGTPDIAAVSGQDGPSIVLAIEDNEASLLLLRHVVQRESDLTFLHTATVAGALRLAAQRRPGFILLDLQLADGNGEELISALRGARETRRIPIVVITADADLTVMSRVISAGAVDSLPKPVSVNRLREVIRKVIPLRDLPE